MTPGLAIQVAWQRNENVPKAENGKKSKHDKAQAIVAWL